MRREEAERLLDRLCAYFDKTLSKSARDVWLTELCTLDASVGAAAVRSLGVGSKFWPAIAELYEQVGIIREQRGRERREQEQREANEEYDNLERPPLREIPAVVEFVERMQGTLPLDYAPDGVCDDHCGREGVRYTLGSFRLCHKCAARRLRAGSEAA